MAARLGDVLYWLGCGIAFLWCVPIALVIASPGQEAWVWGFTYAFFAIISWLLGRAARYILRGS